jgi:hypothetical protein
MAGSWLQWPTRGRLRTWPAAHPKLCCRPHSDPSSHAACRRKPFIISRAKIYDGNYQKLDIIDGVCVWASMELERNEPNLLQTSLVTGHGSPSCTLRRANLGKRSRAPRSELFQGTPLPAQTTLTLQCEPSSLLLAAHKCRNIHENRSQYNHQT